MHMSPVPSQKSELCSVSSAVHLSSGTVQLTVWALMLRTCTASSSSEITGGVASATGVCPETKVANVATKAKVAITQGG
jgi:hypothetical protein